MNKVEQIKELVKLLNKASDAYYNSGHTIMSDAEFDAALEELKALETETGFVLSNSPTHNVGAKVLSKQDKITHEVPMLSLDKCHTIEELIKWAGDDDCYLGLKLDGLSTRLTYENGLLVGAVTRGDGIEGSDILEHVKCYSNVPTTIPYKNKLVIDGESIILYNDFERINSELPTDKQYHNARNLASGTLVNLNTDVTKYRNMHFIAWRVIEGIEDVQESNFFKLKYAELLGFQIVFMFTYTNNSSDKENLPNILSHLRKYANDNGIPIDGVIMAKDSIKLSNSLGRTEKFFRHSIAYKFEDEQYETELEDIEWTVGRTGTITPTAIFKTIKIDGTDVSRASMHNLSVMGQLSGGYPYYKGMKLTIYKANQIIPQVKEAIYVFEDEVNSQVFKTPGACPACGGIVQLSKDILTCIMPDCPAKKLAQFTHFVSRKCANIDGLSEATLEKFISLGYIKDLKSIYHLSDYKNELISLDGFGKKSVENLLLSIEKSRDIRLENFIAALGIPDVGTGTAKVIAAYFNHDANKMFSTWHMTIWNDLDGIGTVTGHKIRDYLRDHHDEIYNLSLEMRFVKSESKEVVDNPFNGKIVCVTGKLTRFTRDSINTKLAELGAKAAGSVSKKTDYLITNEQSSSSKYKKAVELNIPIITEDEFLKMIGEDNYD